MLQLIAKIHSQSEREISPPKVMEALDKVFTSTYD